MINAAVAEPDSRARSAEGQWITLPGSLAPWQRVDLRPRVSGYIKAVEVDKGDRVKAGQLLAEIEIPELRADLIRHDAEIAAAEIAVKRLHAARERSRDLILPQDVDDAEARLAIARASRQRALSLIEFAQIKAPFAGVVTQRLADTGGFAAAGGDPLFQLMDASTIRLQIPVPESECALVKIGQAVEARIESLDGTVVEGTVSRTSYALDPETRSLLVEVDLENESLLLQPGMFAMVRIQVSTKPSAMSPARNAAPAASLASRRSAAAANPAISFSGDAAIPSAMNPGRSSEGYE